MRNNGILNTPEIINDAADRIIDAHQKRLREQSILKILLKEHAEVEKSIKNIITAIEQGIVTNFTKTRLDELEEKQSELDAKISIEKTKLSFRLTREEILNYIKSALKKEPQQLIDLLIQKIVLYNDRIEITYKYSDSTKPDDFHRVFPFYKCSTRIQLAPPRHSKKELRVLCAFERQIRASCFEAIKKKTVTVFFLLFSPLCDMLSA